MRVSLKLEKPCLMPGVKSEGECAVGQEAAGGRRQEAAGGRSQEAAGGRRQEAAACRWQHSQGPCRRHYCLTIHQQFGQERSLDSADDPCLLVEKSVPLNVIQLFFLNMKFCMYLIVHCS